MYKKLSLLIYLFLLGSSLEFQCPKDIALQKGDDIEIDIETQETFDCHWEIRNDNEDEFEIKIERDRVIFFKSFRMIMVS